MGQLMSIVLKTDLLRAVGIEIANYNKRDKNEVVISNIEQLQGIALKINKEIPLNFIEYQWLTEIVTSYFVKNQEDL